MNKRREKILACPLLNPFIALILTNGGVYCMLVDEITDNIALQVILIINNEYRVLWGR